MNCMKIRVAQSYDPKYGLKILSPFALIPKRDQQIVKITIKEERLLAIYFYAATKDKTTNNAIFLKKNNLI